MLRFDALTVLYGSLESWAVCGTRAGTKRGDPNHLWSSSIILSWSWEGSQFSLPLRCMPHLWWFQRQLQLGLALRLALGLGLALDLGLELATSLQML